MSDDLPDPPEGWCLTDLGGLLARIESGKSVQAQGRPAGPDEYGVLKLSAVTWGEFDPGENKALLPGQDRGGMPNIQKGDLLITRANTPELIGAVVLVRQEYPHLLLSDKTLRLVPSRDLVCPEFLLYALRTPWVRKVYEKQATGTSDSMRNLSQDKIRSAPILLPPLSEQRRIVARLEEVQARSRKAREALEAIPMLLEQYRQSVLASAFRGDLTADWREQHPDVEPASALLDRVRQERRRQWEEKNPRKKYVEPEPVDDSDLPELPEGWCWTNYDAIAGVQLGQRRAPEYIGATESRYIRSANITWEGLDLTDVKSMGFADAEPLKLRQGDVLLNEASGSPTEVGKPALWNDEIADCCFQATVIRLRLRSIEMSPQWLHFHCLRDAVLGEYAARCPGLGIIHLTANLLRTWPLPLAPLDEQREIIRRLAEHELTRRRVLPEVRQAIEEADRLDQSILAKAFRGELVEQDPTDEPASALLERIRASRAASNGTVRKARRNRT